MKLDGRILATLLGLVAATQTQAAPAPNLTQSLKNARYQLVLKNDRFAGDGAALLRGAIAGARFIAVGEIHLTQQVPAFTTALCDEMAADGLTAMAIEVGPEAARSATSAIHTADPSAAMAATLHRYPSAAAFLDMREEVTLVDHCAKQAGPSFQLWGLDQEFVGAAGMLLDEIAAEKLAPDAAGAIATLRAIEAEDAAHAAADGDIRKIFLLAAPEAPLTAAATALRAGGTNRANQLFQALLDSRAIYLAHSTNSAAGNRARGLLLKHTLMGDLHAAGMPIPRQRVLLKFGDSHLYRGINDLHQPDLGNLVSELADANGVASLHIAVLGLRGTERTLAGYQRPTRLEQFNLADDPDARWLRPLLDAADPNGWTLFDLRALRFHHLTDANADLDRYIYGYDFLVLAPNITPATPL